MATPREEIISGVDQLKGGIEEVNQLFTNFVQYFKFHPGYKYGLTSKKPEDILDKVGACDVYCETLAFAFKDLVNRGRTVPYALVECVQLESCLTKKDLPMIFDYPYNVCEPKKKTDQYLFKSKHVFCKYLQNYYDPLFGVKGGSEGFCCEFFDFINLSHYQYQSLTGGEYDAVISMQNVEVIMRKDGDGYIRLTPQNLNKKSFKELLAWYKTKKPDIYKKYQKYEPKGEY
jgi:hypothetical protein